MSTTELSVTTNKDLAFPTGEFKDRLAQTRVKMTQLGLDALVVMGPEDLYYLTGFRSMGYIIWQALIVTPNNEPVMVSRSLEQRMYQNNSWIDSYRAYDDHEDPVEVTAKLITELGLTRKRIGFPLGSFFVPSAAADSLKDRINQAEWIDATQLVAKIRWRKSPLEVAMIREAADYTKRGMIAAAEAVQTGRTENDVAAACLSTMITAGSEHPSLGPLVGSGYRSTFGHASWENRTLTDGDLIFIEAGGCKGRYHAGLMRTVSIGKPTEKARLLENASRAGLNAALQALKPGATSGDVDRACRQAVDEAGGGEYFRHRTGYSIGIGFSNWIDGFSIRPHDETLIQENMVVHIVPFLSTEDIAVAISETALVTERGSERLIDLEQEIWVK